jgi:phage-related protein
MLTLTSSGTVVNPGTVYSLPRIKVYGTGSRTLTVDGKPIVLNLLSGNLTLDSELKECSFGDTAQNNRMTGDFPVLEVGSNAISLGSGITKVEIEPRWRYL